MPRLNVNTRRPVRCNLNRNSENTMGGWFDIPNISTIIEDPKAALKQTTSSIESSVKEASQEYIPEQYQEKVSSLVKKQGEKIGESLEAKATGYITEQAQKYASQPEVQESAIRGGINAMADKISNVAVDINKTFQEGGIGSVYKKYPVPFYAIGGVATLLTLRFVLGGRKKVVIQKSANPRKNKKKVLKRRKGRKSKR